MGVSEKSRSDWLGRGILGPTEEDPDQAGTTIEDHHLFIVRRKQTVVSASTCIFYDSTLHISHAYKVMTVLMIQEQAEMLVLVKLFLKVP